MNIETKLDRHLHAFREDLADKRLEGRIEAGRFVEGAPARIERFFADVKSAPRDDAGMDTQFLYGETVNVFENREGWAWVQSARDNYVGYVASDAIGAPGAAPTHTVRVPRTFLYPGPDMKLARSGYRSMGSLLNVSGFEETRGMRFAILDSGDAVFAAHIGPVGDDAGDYVDVAEQLLSTPYLWGGTSGFGLDCSGLVHLSFRLAGQTVLRDTYMQAETVGTVIGGGADRPKLRRGDLVFWKGHVAIMRDADTALHANANTMMVSSEPLETAIGRIEPMYGLPTVYRRP